MSLGKGNTYSADILGLALNATPIANIADNAASSPVTQLFIALHTASPEAGTQNTNEVSYTGYSRVAVNRNNSTKKWTLTGASAVNVDPISFGIDTVGNNITATHFSVGTLASGAGEVLYCGLLTAQLVINPGITPSFAAGAITITED
jgi:hypothetical protein